MGGIYVYIYVYIYTRNFRYRTVSHNMIFWGYSLLHSPYIGLIYGRYLHVRFLKWPLETIAKSQETFGTCNIIPLQVMLHSVLYIC